MTKNFNLKREDRQMDRQTNEQTHIPEKNIAHKWAYELLLLYI